MCIPRGRLVDQPAKYPRIQLALEEHQQRRFPEPASLWIWSGARP
jgi:hypothetical protein